jgi:hypothetical protein
MSQDRSKIWWIGEWRRKMKFRQLCALREYVADRDVERPFLGKSLSVTSPGAT